MSSIDNSPSSNEHSNDFVLDLNQGEYYDDNMNTAITNASVNATTTTTANIDVDFDLNTPTTDELLDNLELMLKDDQFLQSDFTNLFYQQSNNDKTITEAPTESSNDTSNDDIQLIDIKNEPVEPLYIIVSVFLIIK